ncbi:hypothetical protein ACFPER_04940 [Agromyces aurantiacus]|uniref:Uncharacterized protein n=1 Tax=Agromyces aurantiacus TaxID=165814 RepID=A0ABV9R714_9MICO|nr:hypothetical protein [Agromyces aurantiacus]MBM7502804.1 hypothetical protein [Agromyces aurantiacus]
MPRPALDRDEVRRRRTSSAQAWADALGDATSCTIAKDGRSHPTAKFQEGRAAALGDLLRRTDRDATADAILAAAAALAEEWERRRPPGGGDRNWESYRAGALQALRDLEAPWELS